MKLSQKIRLADKYNYPDTVIVVASFPGRGDRSIKDIDAVASYTDHFTRSFRKTLSKSGQKMVVLAQMIDREEWYEENGMLIARVWRKNSPLCFAQILSALLFFSAVRTILVQFEFHQFGGNVNSGLFPVFLAGLKMLGKKITLVLHQVVTDITTLSGHVNITSGTKRAAVFNSLLSNFYRLTCRLADHLVVHNSILAERIRQLTGRTDVAVIPHGLGAVPTTASRSAARQALGYSKKDFVVMYFGFLTWYKGADWLVRQFAQHSQKNVKLLMAGGLSPNLKGTPHYQKFTHTIEETVKTAKNIQMMGFIEERDIRKYYAAADLVVLPYRTLMSSSGPLAMTIGFRKPFLMSTALAGYTQDPDFSRALSQVQLKPADVTFARTPAAFGMKLQQAKRQLPQLAAVSVQLRTTRHWGQVAGQFQEIVNRDFARGGKFAIMQGDTLAYAKS